MELCGRVVQYAWPAKPGHLSDTVLLSDYVGKGTLADWAQFSR